MNHRAHQHFQVTTPGRAYTVLALVCGLLLAVGLVLPLALASSASDAEPGHSDSGPVAYRGGSNGSGSSATTSSADQIAESTQGVAADSVKIGVIMLDLSSVEPLGLALPNYGTDIQEAAYEAMFDKINAAGGIDGRRIEPVYRSYDPLAQNGPHAVKAVCIDLAKDEKVFAVLGTTTDGSDCVTLQYGVPFISGGSALEEVYQKAHGLLVTQGATLQRQGRDWASVIVQSGLTEGHKLGMVTTSDGGGAQLPAEAAADELKALGHPLAVLGELDPVDAISQVPTLIQKMKSSGVDTVMLASDFSNALRFVALAEAQHYYPQYLTSGIGALSANGLMANASESFDGAIGVLGAQSETSPETPGTTKCREDYNEATTTDDIPPGVQSAVPTLCNNVLILERALTDAGDDLNTRTLIQAVEGIGTDLDDKMAGLLSGSFGPGKTDYEDQLQPVRWAIDCKCYSADGDPVDVN